MVANKPIKIIVYGVFPTIYNMCAPCCTRDYLLDCAPSYPSTQLEEYPESVKRNQLFLEKLTKKLIEERLPVQLQVVSADSLAGLFYSMKYRLGGRLAVIVGGRVLRGGELSVEKVLEVVKSEIATR